MPRSRNRSFSGVALVALVTGCGATRQDHEAPPCPANPASMVSAAIAACALTGDGSLVCWGSDQLDPAPSGAFVQVSTEQFHACALTADSAIKCWGGGEIAALPPPSGPFTQVSTGEIHACGLRADGSATCWGERYDESNQPTGVFTKIGVSTYEACGLRVDGSMDCWSPTGSEPSWAGDFKDLSLGLAYRCALTRDGSATCRIAGREEAQFIPGVFQQLDAGFQRACGVRDDGTLACWKCGPDSVGCQPCTAEAGGCSDSVQPPAGAFTQVSQGYTGTCGVREGGAVMCWGDSVLAAVPERLSGATCD